MNNLDQELDKIFDAIEIFEGDDSNGKEYQAGYNDMALACRLMKQQLKIEVKQAVSAQVANARLEETKLYEDWYNSDNITHIEDFIADRIAELRGKQ